MDKSGNLSQVRGGAEIRTKPYRQSNLERIEEARRLGAIVFTADQVQGGWLEYRQRQPSRSYSLKPIDTHPGFEPPPKGSKKPDHAAALKRREETFRAMKQAEAEITAAQWEHYERWRWIARSWRQLNRIGPTVPFDAWYESNPLIWFRDRCRLDVPRLDWGAAMTFPQIVAQAECRDLCIKTLHTWRRRGSLVAWEYEGKWHTSIAHVNACRYRESMRGGRREGSGRKPLKNKVATNEALRP